MRKILMVVALIAMAACQAFCFEWTDVYEQTQGKIYSKTEMFTATVTPEQLEEIIVNHAGVLNASQVTTGKLPMDYQECRIIVQHTYGLNGKKVIMDEYGISIYSYEDYVVYTPKKVSNEKELEMAQDVVSAGTSVFSTVGAFLTAGSPLVDIIAVAADLTASAAINKNEKSAKIGLTNEYVEKIFLPNLESILNK